MVHAGDTFGVITWTLLIFSPAGEVVGGCVATSWKDRQAVPRAMVQSPRPQHQEGRMESGGRPNRLRGSGNGGGSNCSDNDSVAVACKLFVF